MKNSRQLRAQVVALKAENAKLKRLLERYSTRHAETLDNAQDELGQHLTYSEIASLTGIPVGTWRWWVWAGKAPHVRLGKRTVRFSAAETKAWLANSEVGGSIDRYVREQRQADRLMWSPQTPCSKCSEFNARPGSDTCADCAESSA